MTKKEAADKRRKAKRLADRKKRAKLPRNGEPGPKALQDLFRF